MIVNEITATKPEAPKVVHYGNNNMIRKKTRCGLPKTRDDRIHPHLVTCLDCARAVCLAMSKARKVKPERVNNWEARVRKLMMIELQKRLEARDKTMIAHTEKHYTKISKAVVRFNSATLEYELEVGPKINLMKTKNKNQVEDFLRRENFIEVNK